MANRPQRMKIRDIRRIISATRSAGVNIGSVKVDPATGEVTITAGKPGVANGSGLDDWMATHADQAEGH
jgi:hypothetical protein